MLKVDADDVLIELSDVDGKMNNSEANLRKPRNRTRSRPCWPTISAPSITCTTTPRR